VFITVEGGEGSGKTTLIQGLKARLEALGYDVLTTREPGGTALGDRVRSMLLAKSEELNIAPLSELFLFLASRSQHLEEVIRPALRLGKIVICDRFNDSSVAYQGRARGLGIETVRNLCEVACAGTLPDFTILLDIDPQIGLERSKTTQKKESVSGAHDRIESETLEFHRKVRETLQDEAKRRSQKAVIIDATASKEALLEQVMGRLKPILKK